MKYGEDELADFCWYEECENFSESCSKNCRQWTFPDEDCIIFNDKFLKKCYVDHFKWEAICKYIDKM